MSRVKARAQKFSLSFSFCAAYAYVLASILILSGIWRLDVIVLAIACYLYARWAQHKRAKVLVLRRFGTPRTELFVHRIVGGIQLGVTSIWLYDERAKFRPSRTHLLSVWTYVSRLLTWVVLGWGIIGTVKGRLPYEILRMSWVIVASCLYHRYKAGQSPTRWVACVLGALLTFEFRSTLRDYFPITHQNAWLDVLAIVSLFLVSWLLFMALLRTKPLKFAFSWMHRKRVVETPDELEQYAVELRGFSIFPRYLTTVQTVSVELACTADTWGEVVYETLGHCSLVVADVTDLDIKTSLAWELEQAYYAAVPVILTCEEESVNKVVADLSRLNHEAESSVLNYGIEDLFIWRQDPSVPQEVPIRYDDFHKLALSKIRKHAEDLKHRLPEYLPFRPSRAEALLRLKSMRDAAASPNSGVHPTPPSARPS